MSSISLAAPAKINRFLHVCGRREDGYHNLQTVFQFLSLADTLHITSRSDGQIRLLTEMPGIAHEDNLIVRAAETLKQYAMAHQISEKPMGASIRIDKQLPQGGGIGGGSSNAASTLYALNQLWQLQLTLADLKQLALGLGADVPVFLHGHAAWAEGVGESLTTLAVDDAWCLLAVPDCEVSTAEIFSHSWLTRDSKIKTIAAFLEQGGNKRLVSEFRNDCEALVRKLYPQVDHAINLLSQFGQAQMTGTGACAFVLFDSQDAAVNAQQQLPESLHTEVCQALATSPMLAE